MTKVKFKTGGDSNSAVFDSSLILLGVTVPIGILIWLWFGIGFPYTNLWQIGVVFAVLPCFIAMITPILNKYYLNTPKKKANYHKLICNIVAVFYKKTILIQELNTETFFYKIKERPMIEVEFHGDFREQLKCCEYGRIKYFDVSKGLFSRLVKSKDKIYGLQFQFNKVPRNGFMAISYI